MSFVVQSDVTTNEKRVLTLMEHKRLIAELRFGNVESTLRSLMKFSLDKSLEESEKVIKLLESLCDASHIGIIIEWTVRFLKNQLNEQKIQPIPYTFERRIVNDMKPVYRNREKDLSYGLEFRRYQVAKKIHSNPEEYYDQLDKINSPSMYSQEFNESTSLTNEYYSVSTTSYDPYDDRSDFVYNCDI